MVEIPFHNPYFSLEFKKKRLCLPCIDSPPKNFNGLQPEELEGGLNCAVSSAFKLAVSANMEDMAANCWVY